jgi:predicted dehydrogenase
MPRIRTIVIGTGGMARHHIRTMLLQRRTTDIVGFVEVSERSREAVVAMYEEKGHRCPPFFDSIRNLVKVVESPDAALICTPHKFHYENTRDCLKQGMDICLEKPMVVNASEARRLIKARDKADRLLVVAFPGSLSPAVQKAKKLIAEGAIGKVTCVSAHAHQNWKRVTTGTWRQDPDLSGGGFLFDTGSHMINTVVDLIGEDIAEVVGMFDNRGTPVEIASAVSGRFCNDVLFSMNGAGDSIQCASTVHVFGDKGVLETGIWGERLLIKTDSDPEFHSVKYARSRGVWEQFVKVRQGRLENPCPAEVGLRFAKLMDMIRESANSGRKIRSR